MQSVAKNIPILGAAKNGTLLKFKSQAPETICEGISNKPHGEGVEVVFYRCSDSSCSLEDPPCQRKQSPQSSFLTISVAIFQRRITLKCIGLTLLFLSMLFAASCTFLSPFYEVFRRSYCKNCDPSVHPFHHAVQRKHICTVEHLTHD
jgi:hypothetical protein